MAKNKKPMEPPAITPEARENQLISLAINCAEQQLRNGTASSQVITHYLKLGSMKEQLEMKLMEQDLALKAAKTESLKSAKRIDEMYAKAIAAMRHYSGNFDDGDPND